jgi:hypothetical protein
MKEASPGKQGGKLLLRKAEHSRVITNLEAGAHRLTLTPETPSDPKKVALEGLLEWYPEVAWLNRLHEVSLDRC